MILRILKNIKELMFYSSFLFLFSLFLIHPSFPRLTHSKILTKVISFFFSFLGPHQWDMEVPRLGFESELQLLAYNTATETWDLRRIFNLHTAHSKAGSPTPWVRPGIKPTSSWIPVGFVSAAPQWELPQFVFKWNQVFLNHWGESNYQKKIDFFCLFLRNAYC